MGDGDGPTAGAQRASFAAPDVFISYASQDATAANAVVVALEGRGVKCWIAPRDVVPGSLYADEIVRAINEARVVVLVLLLNTLSPLPMSARRSNGPHPSAGELLHCTPTLRRSHGHSNIF